MINRTLADKIKEETAKSIRLKELAIDEKLNYDKREELRAKQREVYVKKEFFKKLKSAVEEQQKKEFEERRLRTR